MISVNKSVDTAVGRHVATALPSVNLLPPEVLERTQLRRLQSGLGVVVVGAFVVVGLLAHQASGSIDSADQSLSAATAEQASLRTQAVKYADVTAAYARTAAVQQMLVQAMGPEVRYSRLLNDLALSIPPSVWLTNVTWNQPSASSPSSAASTAATSGSLGTVTFSGVAYAHDDVAVWLETLAREKGYDVAYLQSSTESLIGTRKVVDWTSSVVLTDGALSGRYVPTGG